MISANSKKIESIRSGGRSPGRWLLAAAALLGGTGIVAGCTAERHSGASGARSAGEAKTEVAAGGTAAGNSETPSDLTSQPGTRSADADAAASETDPADANPGTDEAFRIPISPGRPESSAALRAEATAVLTAVARHYPSFPDALEVKARMHFLFGENERAEADWRKALALNPDYGYAHLGIGKVAIRQDRLEEAERHLKRAVELLPLLEEAALELAKVYTLQGRLDEAIGLLQKFVEKKPDAAESQLVLGQTFLTMRDYERAKEAFERTLELRPDAVRAQEGLGRTLIRLGQRQEARKLLEAQAAARRSTESTNRTPEEVFRDEQRDISRCYVDAGRILVHHRQLDAAESVYRKATLLDAHNMDAWNLLLRVLQQVEKFDQALAMAQEMCQANPDDATAQWTLALLGGRVGEVDTAIAAMERVVELTPQDASAYQAYARILLEARRDFPRAMQLAHRAVELRGSASDHEMYAQTLAVNQQFEKAREELEVAIGMDPDNLLYRGALQQLDAFLKTKSGR